MPSTSASSRPRPDTSLRLGRRVFDLAARPLVMAILNVTPDSFWDGGRYTSRRRLRERIRRIRDEGADLVDIGGESTRPGSKPVPPAEELRRVLPAYEACRELAPDLPVSVDTWKAEVAERLLEAGAEMVNDISGLTFDPRLLPVLREHRPAVVLMHTSGPPAVMQRRTRYRDVVRDVLGRLRDSLRKAERAGLTEIVLDPGIGFGKTTDQNFEILRRLEEFLALGRPLLVGLSRKSLIGNALGLPVEKRLAATVALNLHALLHGASLIRVHDVAEGRHAVELSLRLRSRP